MIKGQAEHGAVDNLRFRANLEVSLSAFAVEAMATLLTLQPQPPTTERVWTRIWNKVRNGQ